MAALIDMADLHPHVAEMLADCDEDLQRATLMVWLCHVGADQKLRQQQAIKWWSSFLPERVTLCARVGSTLSEFAAELCGRLQGKIGQSNDEGGAGQRDLFLRLCGLPGEEQRRILDCLETQATVCATFVRADQDAKRTERKNDGQRTLDI